MAPRLNITQWSGACLSVWAGKTAAPYSLCWTYGHLGFWVKMCTVIFFFLLHMSKHCEWSYSLWLLFNVIGNPSTPLSTLSVNRRKYSSFSWESIPDPQPLIYFFFLWLCLFAGAPVWAANQGAGSGAADCGQSAGKMQTWGRVARRW